MLNRIEKLVNGIKIGVAKIFTIVAIVGAIGSKGVLKLMLGFDLYNILNTLLNTILFSILSTKSFTKVDKMKVMLGKKEFKTKTGKNRNWNKGGYAISCNSTHSYDNDCSSYICPLRCNTSD